MSPGGGNDNSLQYSCLENHTDRGAWWVTVYGVTESDTTKHAQALIQFMRAKPSLRDLITSLKPPYLNSNGSCITTVSVEIKLTTFMENQREIMEKAKVFQKKSTSASLTTLKPLTVWITTNCRKS